MQQHSFPVKRSWLFSWQTAASWDGFQQAEVLLSMRTRSHREIEKFVASDEREVEGGEVAVAAAYSEPEWTSGSASASRLAVMTLDSLWGKLKEGMDYQWLLGRRSCWRGCWGCASLHGVAWG